MAPNVAHNTIVLFRKTRKCIKYLQSLTDRITLENAVITKQKMSKTYIKKPMERIRKWLSAEGQDTQPCSEEKH